MLYYNIKDYYMSHSIIFIRLPEFKSLKSLPQPVNSCRINLHHLKVQDLNTSISFIAKIIHNGSFFLKKASLIVLLFSVKTGYWDMILNKCLNPGLLWKATA